MKKTKTPLIRIKGFDDEWKQYSIDQIADRYDNLRIPVSADLRIPGNVPYYGANGIQDYVDGFTHEGEFVLIAEDGANDIINYPVRCVKGKIWVNNHAHVLKGKEQVINNNFFAYALHTADIGSLLVGGGRAKLNADVLMHLILSLPSKKEQIKIGDFFSNMDELIVSEKNQIKKLQIIKKYSLEKMFPQNSSNIPELRFNGFTEPWQKKKAKELFVTVSDKGYTNLPVLSATQDRGMIRRDKNDINIYHNTNNEKGYKRVLPGQFVIHLRSFQGGFAHSNTEGITSPAYTVFDFINTETQNDIFWKYIFTSDNFIKRLETVTYGIRDGRSISYDEFLLMDFNFPSKEEQTKIANFICTLDSLLSIHQKKLCMLKNIEKTCLEKMFV